ncbi:MAG TPA: tRNA pseudouridine(55) synthase TruB [Candidatus Paceibacterota bacterium]
MHPELLLVDKPKGITSFGVIARLRKALNTRKMGHAGTLDPLASGLMLVGVEKGTKKLAELIKLPKTYEAEIVLGERRSTGDMEGTILEESVARNISEDLVRKALSDMEGIIELPVPAFSALKRDGKPLYVRARRGEMVETPIRAMEVRSAVLDRIETHGDRTHAFITFDVGSGTYIRSLAEELGRRLGHPATLGNLRRTRIGEFDIEDAQALP